MFGKQIKSEATRNRLKRAERTFSSGKKLRLCQHSTMLHRANILLFLSSTVHLDVTTWGNFLNYLHMTGVCLSELGGSAAWHHHNSSLPHMGLVLCLSCHIFLLDVSIAQCYFWWEVTSLGCLWNPSYVFQEMQVSLAPCCLWGQPSAGVSAEIWSSLVLHCGTFHAFLSPFHMHERGLSHSRSKNMLWRLKFSLPCLPFIYSVCSLLNAVSPTDCGSVGLVRLLQRLCSL